MADNYFDEYANPWLDKLQNDPTQPEPPNLQNPTTFPISISDWNDNQLTEIEGDLEGNIESDSNVAVEDINAARSARQMAGLDILAFYKSFRFVNLPPFRGKWGIFLLDAGIEGLTYDLMSLLPNEPRAEVRKFSRDILLEHERYHFWIDAWALGQELTPLLPPLFKKYEYYLNGKRSVELTPDDIEESLANHYLHKKLSRKKLASGRSTVTALRAVLLDSPSPYSDCLFDALERTKREGYLASAVANGKSPVVARVISKLANGGLESSHLLSASIMPVDRRHPVAGANMCPTYNVATSGYASLVTPFQGPERKKCMNFIENYLGGKKDSQTDHEYYRIDNGEKIKIPNEHSQVIYGYELKNILRKAGMTHKEYKSEEQQTKNWTIDCPRSPFKPPLG
jgi:hypothetical protein